MVSICFYLARYSLGVDFGHDGTFLENLKTRRLSFIAVFGLGNLCGIPKFCDISSQLTDEGGNLYRPRFLC